MDLNYLKIPHIDESENEFIERLAPKILEYQKPFVLSHNTISQGCRRDSQKFLTSLKKFDLWALKMYDASAKLSSGVLNGNVNRYGDFDQCLDVVADGSDFQGQYCLAYIQPTVTSDLKYLNFLRTLVLSFESYKSDFDDERHVVPKTSQMNFAFCIPSTCSNKELELVLGENLQNFFNNTGLRMDVRVEPEMCQTKTNENYSTGTKLSLLLFGFIIFISIYAAFYDRADRPNKNEWLTSFSLSKNWKDLVSTKASNDIASAHGIRFLHTVMLIISHKCMEIDFNPMPNRNDLASISKSSMTVTVRASYLYTDTFIMLSSMLVTYSFIGRLNRGQKINVWKEIATRYFRVVPPMAALILFGTFILPILGSGPQWPLLITNQSQLCKVTWWRNFFMIHNWFGFENICMTHTHHIGTDFELFLTAPFLVILLHKYPKKTSWGIFIAALLSTVARYYITYARNMTVYVLFGLDISKLYEIASYMYILPFYRFTVYAIGIFLGYLLRKHQNIKLTDFQLTCGWVISTALFIGTIVTTAIMSRYDYTFNAIDGANFAALAPIPWCLFFGWIIYTSHLGYKNFFTQIFEWRIFLITTKLSYGIYLVQFAVFHYNIATVRNTIHFDFVKTIINTNEIFCIILAATVITLFFDSPFGNLKKMIFDTKREPQKPEVIAKKEPNIDVNSNELSDHKKIE
ncbi:hypothetical protein PVAND_013877 [Polypedilum vanderplanki]|uniref:Nose resistant-to-fluoxetine protein N-terminal domain-containing protein n=1 Tax=Polypedilum vanderplanki TaxID=319348 RepID=A0A9J6CSV7_POLVA|nr:hypothetical protein PVAND_013877 [Polypedilum vanderplanki]